MCHFAYIIANYANICVCMYHVKLGVEELRVGEWSEVGSGGVESGGVSGSGRFSECFAVDSAVHKSLLPTPLYFHYFHTAL